MYGGIATPRPANAWVREAVSRRPLAVELLSLSVLLAVAAVAFGRNLHAAALYDEGVYLASLDALEHGQRLGTQVFASQPPGFYLLLEGARAVFGPSVGAMRAAMLVLALVGCVSAYYVGRCVAGVLGGLVAVLVLVAPTRIETEAVVVRNVFPSVALSLLSIALAFAAARRQGHAALVAAVLSGAALGAAVSVKLLAVTAVAPVFVILLRRRSARFALGVVGGAAAVLASILITYSHDLRPLWNDAVRFHLRAQSAHLAGAPTNVGSNFTKVLATVADFNGVRSPFPWLVVIGAIGTVVAWRRGQLLDAVPLWTWALVSALFLTWHRPLWAHDVVILIAALGVAAGIGIAALLAGTPRAPRLLAAACILVAAASIGYRLQQPPTAEHSAIKWAAAVLRARTPPGAEVASDLPIVPFLADRRQPGDLVDTSRTRIETGWLTRSDILKAIDRRGVSAVVVGHLFAADRQLLRALKLRFPVVVRRNGVDLFGEGQVDLRIYLRH